MTLLSQSRVSSCEASTDLDCEEPFCCSAFSYYPICTGSSTTQDFVLFNKSAGARTRNPSANDRILSSENKDYLISNEICVEFKCLV